MAEQVNLASLVNLSNQTTAVNTINSNNSIIQQAFLDVVSRSAVAPNQWLANQDMNSNRIINLPNPISTTEPVTLSYFNQVLAGGNVNSGLVSGVPVSSAMQPIVNSATVNAALVSFASSTGNVIWTNGRNTYQYTPTYDFGGGSGFNQSAAVVFTTTGLTIPSNSTYSGIGFYQTNSTITPNQATIGSGSQFNGLNVTVESLSGSSVSSNCYASIMHVFNDGPGTTKGIHAGAFASTGSTGVIVAINLQVVPIATTSNGSSCLQVSPTQSAGVADGILTGINIASADINGNLNNVANNGIQYNYVIGCPLTTVPVKIAFLQWQAASNSAGTARFIQLLNNGGAEIQYVDISGNVVSSVNVIGGGTTLGTQINATGINRIPTNGNLIVAAGSASGLIQLQAGGATGLQINSGGSLTFSAVSVVSNGAVATVLGSVGPAGSHTSPQGWFTANFNGTTGYIPFF